MVDLLVAWGVKEAAGFVFKDVLLPLAKGGIEDYAKDSLKEKIKGVVQDEHRKAVGKALKEFLSLLQDELQGAEDNLTLEQIETQFGGAVKSFVHHPDVKPILGEAFGLNGDKIDPNRLAKIWESEHLTRLPNDFRWNKVVRVYREKVKSILIESNELRSLLDSQNLDKIHNRIVDIAGVSVPTLDDERYREALCECYGYLRLNVLDSTDSQHRIKLWSVFIPQQVDVRSTAVSAIGEGWKDDASTLPFLLHTAHFDTNEHVRSTTISGIGQKWKDDASTLPFLIQIASSDTHEDVRQKAIWKISQNWSEETKTLPLLVQIARFDPHQHVRSTALKLIAKGYRDYPERFDFLVDRAVNDIFIKQVNNDDDETNPRLVALFALARQYSDRSEVLDILRDRAINDADPQVRAFATKELIKDPGFD